MSLSTSMHTVAVCSILALTTLLQAGRLPDTARLLPAETLFVVGTENFAELNSRFEKTDIFRFYKDQSMAAFVKEAKDGFIKSLNTKDAIKQFVDADFPLPKGKLSLAMVAQAATPGAKRQEPATIFICQWGSELVRARDLFEKLTKEAEDKGGTRKKEDYRGTQIVSVISAVKADSQEKPKLNYAYCYIDDCLVAADKVELLKFVIAHAAGSTGGSLADDSDYQAAVKTTGAADVSLYFNLGRFMASIAQSSPDADRTIKALGADRIPCIALGGKLAPQQGTSLIAKGLIRMVGAKQGIARILDMAAAPMSIPEFVSDDSCEVAMMNLDIPAIWDEVFRIANTLDPRIAVAMNSPVVPPAADGQPGVEVKKDVLSYLRPGLWAADVPRKSTGSQKTEIVSIIALPITDKAKLEKSLARIHEQYLGRDDKLRRDFLGYTIYSFPVAAAEEEESEQPGTSADAAPHAASEPSQPAFVVTEKYLLFGDIQIIEDAIHSMKDKTSTHLTARKWYRKATASFRPAIGSGAVMDLSVYGEYLWKALKAPKEDASAMGMLAQGIGSEAKFSLLPEFAAVKKYFGIFSSQGASAPDGFVFEYRLLSPVEE